MRNWLWAVLALVGISGGAQAQFYDFGSGGNFGPYNSGFGITAPGTSRSLSLGGPYLGGYYGSSYGGNPGYGYRIPQSGYSSGYLGDRTGYTTGYTGSFRGGFFGRRR